MIHLSSCLYSLSEITNLPSFVSLFFHIYYISICVHHNQVLHYEKQNLFLESALDLNGKNSQIW